MHKYINNLLVLFGPEGEVAETISCVYNFFSLHKIITTLLAYHSYWKGDSAPVNMDMIQRTW